MALVVNNLPANVGDIRDAGLIPGWGSNINIHTHTHNSFLQPYKMAFIIPT